MIAAASKVAMHRSLTDSFGFRCSTEAEDQGKLAAEGRLVYKATRTRE